MKKYCKNTHLVGDGYISQSVVSWIALIEHHCPTFTLQYDSHTIICNFRLRDRSNNFLPLNRANISTVVRITEQLEKPELDDRSYRVVRLPNQLEALLVHDPTTDKASGALDVNVGTFSDDHMPGVAHALEHLLFMGSEKFPEENDFKQYVTSQSGFSNACTGCMNTTYYFQVDATREDVADEEKSSTHSSSLLSTTSPSKDTATSPLYGALDRFAQFFIKPLFQESSLDRELKAVDSENKNNLQSDMWRLNQLEKSLSNPQHPYHHFGTGNWQTLHDDPQKHGVNVRSKIIEFYKQKYSANHMKLVVYGRESLDQLEGWVMELFSEVQNKSLPQNRWDDIQALLAEHLGTQVFMKPIMDFRVLKICFPFLDEEELYETLPSQYISYLIGHEGPGSVLSCIKAKGWANGLSAGAEPVCPGSAFFTISVRLTEEGLTHHQEIVKVIFQYIAMIKEQPPKMWIFNEIKNIAEVNFRFKEKTSAFQFASRFSSVMQKPLPRESC